MSRLIEDQGHYLQLLQSTSELQRKALLTTITKHQLKALCEITHTVLKGTVVLSISEGKKTLKRHRKILTLLGKKKATRREKLKALQSASTAVVLLLNIAGAWLWTRWFWFLTKSTGIWHPGRLQRNWKERDTKWQRKENYDLRELQKKETNGKRNWISL